MVQPKRADVLAPRLHAWAREHAVQVRGHAWVVNKLKKRRRRVGVRPDEAAEALGAASRFVGASGVSELRAARKVGLDIGVKRCVQPVAELPDKPKRPSAALAVHHDR